MEDDKRVVGMGMAGCEGDCDVVEVEVGGGTTMSITGRCILSLYLIPIYLWMDVRIQIQ